MSQFAIDIELVGGPGCGATVTEIPEGQDLYEFAYERLTKKGSIGYIAKYAIDTKTGKSQYIEG